MPAWRNRLSAMLLMLNPAQIPHQKHLSQERAYAPYIIEEKNNRRSIKTSEKREHGGSSPVWATAGSYLNLLMCTRVPVPTTTNQVPPLHSQIKYLFPFPSSLPFESFTPSFVLRTQRVNSIRRPRSENGIKWMQRLERAFANVTLAWLNLVQLPTLEFLILEVFPETNWYLYQN